MSNKQKAEEFLRLLKELAPNQEKFYAEGRQQISLSAFAV
jgi:hypothetical protein